MPITRVCALLSLLLLLAPPLDAQMRFGRTATPVVAGGLELHPVGLTLSSGVEDEVYVGETITLTGGTGAGTIDNNGAGTSLNDSDPDCAGLSLTDHGDRSATIGGTPTAAGGFCDWEARGDTAADAAVVRSYRIPIDAAAAALLPTNYSTVDIGDVGQPGSCAFTDDDMDGLVDLVDEFVLEGTGQPPGIGGTSSEGRVCYTTLSGDGSIKAHITAFTGTNEFAKAGIILMESVAPDAPYAIVFARPIASGNPTLMGYRLTTGATAEQSACSTADPWLQMVREGQLVTFYTSPDDITYTACGSTQTFTWGTDILAGLVVSALDDVTLASATFTSLEIVETVDPDPPSTVEHNNYRPHLQGDGTNSYGGSGRSLATPFTTVIKVDTLSDSSIAGLDEMGGACTAADPVCEGASFRWAITRPFCAFIVFEVAGVIVQQGAYDITQANGCKTIAGQTAPSPGITISGSGLTPGSGSQRGFRIMAPDVVVQHVRTRGMGYPCEPTTTVQCYETSGFIVQSANEGIPARVLLDQVSAAWTSGKAIAVWRYDGQPYPSDVAVHSSLFTESLEEGKALVGGEARHSKGVSWGYATSGTFRHNLLANIGDRLVRGSNIGLFAMVENYIYNNRGANGSDGNWSSFSRANGLQPIGGCGPTGGRHWAHVGNVYQNGPNSTTATRAFYIYGGHDDDSLYLFENVDHEITGPAAIDQWAMVGVTGTDLKTASICGGNGSNEAMTAAKIRTLTPQGWFTAINFDRQPTTTNALRDFLIANAGARPLDRDEVDERAVAHILAGTGDIYLNWTEVDAATYFKNHGTGSRAVVVPANHNAAGDCGSAQGIGGTLIPRRVIECWAEHDATYGARRLEPRW